MRLSPDQIDKLEKISETIGREPSQAVRELIEVSYLIVCNIQRASPHLTLWQKFSAFFNTVNPNVTARNEELIDKIRKMIYQHDGALSHVK